MSKAIPSIQTQTFPLTPEAVGFDDFSFHALRFPESWEAIYSELQRIKYNSEHQPKRLPLKGLVASLFPELIAVNTSLRGKTWLSATEAIPSLMILQLVTAWLKAYYEKTLERNPHLLDEIDRMKEDDLKWREEPINLAEIKPGKWNTAEFVNSESYALLPELLARSLTKTENGLRRTLPFGGRGISFLRAPSLNGTGVDLVSWQPLSDPETGTHFYSVYLKIFLQLVPFQPFPNVALNVGTRRWVSQPRANLGRGKHSLYLLTKLDGKNPADIGSRFQVTSVRKAGANENFVLKYDETLAALYENFFGYALPDLARFAENPADAMNAVKTKILMAYSDRMFHRHEISKGSRQKNRGEIFAGVETMAGVADFFTKDFNLPPSAPVERCDKEPCAIFAPFYQGEVNEINRNQIFTGKISQKHKKEKREPETIDREMKDLCREQRKYLAENLGEILPLEIWYQNEETCAVIFRQISELLGLKYFDKEETDEKTTWRTPEITIEVVAKDLGNLARPLEFDENSTQERASWRRAEEVKRAVGKSAKPISCVVEIEHKNRFEPQRVKIGERFRSFETDPKNALRIGFANAGRLTQFINTPYAGNGGKNYREAVSHLPQAALSSFRDALRQLGLFGDLPRGADENSNWVNSMNYAAVWIHRKEIWNKAKRRNEEKILPVMIFIDAKGKRISAVAYGSETPTTYSEFLLKLSDRSSLGNFDEWMVGYKEIGKIFKRWTEKFLKAGSLTVFANPQNSKQGWIWLMDKNLSPDKISFEWSDNYWDRRCENYEEISQWKELRVVRVRTAKGNEVPQHFTPNPSFSIRKKAKEFSITQGVFTLGEKVFYGLAEKPTTARKLVPPYVSKSLDPTEQVWNANLLEIIPCFLQAEDAPAEFAHLTHSLRDAGVNFSDEYQLPLPLHLAELTKEFIPDFATDEESDS